MASKWGFLSFSPPLRQPEDRLASLCLNKTSASLPTPVQCREGGGGGKLSSQLLEGKIYPFITAEHNMYTRRDTHTCTYSFFMLTCHYLLLVTNKLICRHFLLQGYFVRKFSGPSVTFNYKKYYMSFLSNVTITELMFEMFKYYFACS